MNTYKNNDSYYSNMSNVHIYILNNFNFNEFITV